MVSVAEIVQLIEIFICIFNFLIISADLNIFICIYDMKRVNYDLNRKLSQLRFKRR